MEESINLQKYIDSSKMKKDLLNIQEILQK